MFILTLDAQFSQFPLQVFLLAALVAVSSSRPRYLVIPLEDVDFEGGQFGQLPVYRIPQLARQARAAQEEDSLGYPISAYEQAQLASVYQKEQLRLARAAQEEDSFQNGPYAEEYQEPRDNSPAGR